MLLALPVGACKKEKQNIAPPARAVTQAPQGFPAIPFPEDNPYSEAKWKLGKKLFYDNIFATDFSISCASCHKQENAFSDVVAKSEGAGGLIGRRNAPTLANVAYQPYFTREGGLATLEKQILVPIQEHDEFNFNIVKIAERMQAIPEYVTLSMEAFGREPDAYVITRALSTFERTLVSGDSPYDKHINGLPTTGFGHDAQRGMQLFFSERTSCGKCHSGFNFTDYSFKNNGLYTNYADVGRMRLTEDPKDVALFKVPTLRNIELTAPYMHDGSINTLEEVIEHYNSGGMPHINKSPFVKPLMLTQQEQADLIAFLRSLTDVEFITNKNFRNEDQ
ncbi:MAG: c-type cytochrome [Chitinophagales bacterium]|nr:c-type cytochrome [Chitinophagales bacterium]